MFNKSHRFHGYGSVRSVQARGQTARGGMLSLKYVQRNPTKPYRVAVVVSRKVNKSAVVRNRIRRRVYEALRTSAQPPGNIDLVFAVYDERVATMPAKQLQALVVKLVQQASK